MSFASIIDIPITKSFVNDGEFLNYFNLKLKDKIITNVSEKYSEDIINKVLLEIVSPNIRRRNEKNKKQLIYYFSENTPRGCRIKEELSNNNYQINNQQLRFDDNDEKIVVEKIINKLKEKFIDFIIETDILRTYIVIDWN